MERLLRLWRRIVWPRQWSSEPGYFDGELRFYRSDARGKAHYRRLTSEELEFFESTTAW